MTLSPDIRLRSDPSTWSDQELRSHELVNLWFHEVPLDRMEEARLVQMEHLRRQLLSGDIDPCYEDSEEVRLALRARETLERFSSVCASWRADMESPPVEVPSHVRTNKEYWDYIRDNPLQEPGR